MCAGSLARFLLKLPPGEGDLGMSQWVSLSLGGVLFAGLAQVGACGKAREVFTDGVLVVHEGVITRVDEAEAGLLCETRFCEPNFVYEADFGRRRPRPAPAPPPQPELIPERLDYSRRILGMDEAWNLTEGSRDVIVAVVDSGVDYTHPDLRNNIWVNSSEQNGLPGVDDDHNGFVDDVYGWDFANNRPNAMDDHGHGTHCAGIIGAEKNGIGTVGVSPKVRIMPLKFLNAQGSGDTLAAIGAIRYAVAMGARVISNSWGGGGYSVLLDQAIQDAVGRGVVFVAAAGNSAADNDFRPNYPASYPNVIAVASTDEQDGLSSFSNYGTRSVLVAAPGSRILSSIPGLRWAESSGTSMATPQVAGAIALGLSLRPSAGVAQIRDALCAGSAPILTERVFCGRLSVAEFLRRL